METRFRSRVREITAEQYRVANPPPRGMCVCAVTAIPHVHTMHGNQFVLLEDGDWVVPEPDGVHFYPIKPDIMDKNYQAVEDLPYPGEASDALLNMRRLAWPLEEWEAALERGDWGTGTKILTLDPSESAPADRLDFKLFYDRDELAKHIKQLKCEHDQFAVNADVHRLTSEEGGPVTSYTMDLTVWCVVCELPFHFVGFPFGMRLEEPAMSMNGCEARLPLKPGPMKINASGTARFEFQ